MQKQQESIVDINQVSTKDHGMPINLVGMDNIHIPALVSIQGQIFRILCSINAHINLRSRGSRGIHMSRLYLILKEHLASQPLDLAESIDLLLEAFILSHESLSDEAHLKISYELAVEKPALKSDKTGWMNYPYVIEAFKNKSRPSCFIQSFVLIYSSTCPCSAALSRQLIQQKFAKDHKERHTLEAAQVEDWLGKESSILATPHGQRSKANLQIIPKQGRILSHDALIDLIFILEKALGTPVQGAVKREDEQEFARLNGTHLMFSEDAARKLADALTSHESIEAFCVTVSHLESLHPHNAVASICSSNWKQKALQIQIMP